ncbi:MAG: hypothetical protein M0Z54_05210 [Thermaerobacter sp.]|nr:hypothetical protein [Thermaerobacter sp.]
MKASLVIVPLAALVAIILALRLVVAHDGHAFTESSTLRLHITTLGRCALPRLPAWTESSATAHVFGLDAYYHDVYATTYLEGEALSLTAWTQQRWLFAVTQVVGPSSTGAVEKAFGPVDLPGRGTLFWNNPNDWTVTSTWCTRGRTYHLDAVLNPAAAQVVAKALDTWNKTHASRIACRAIGQGSLSIACRPEA